MKKASPRPGRVAGKVVIITGSSQGMGKATAELFASEGARVIGVDLNRPTTGRKNSPIEFFKLDVANEAGWKKLVRHAIKKHGRIDVLINNAGFSRRAPIIDYPLELFRQTFDVNVVGPFLGIKTVARGMIKNKSGCIINISSVFGLQAGGPNRAPYAASKWAVLGLTKSLALELAPHGVRVNSVHPGAILTPMLLAGGGTPAQIAKDLGIGAGRVGLPGEVAAATLFLASDEASYISGAALTVDGGWSAGSYRPLRPNLKDK